MNTFHLSLFFSLAGSLFAQQFQSVSKTPTVDSIYFQAIQMGYEERYSEALRFFDLVIALDPNVDQIYLDRGIIKSRLGDLHGAITDYSLQLKFSPKEADVYFLRGEIYLSQNDYHNAFRDLRRANRLDKGNADAHCYCAEAAKALNKNQIAKRKEVKCKLLNSTND